MAVQPLEEVLLGFVRSQVSDQRGLRRALPQTFQVTPDNPSCWTTCLTSFDRQAYRPAPLEAPVQMTLATRRYEMQSQLAGLAVKATLGHGCPEVAFPQPL